MINKNVLVLGASGYIGSQLVPILLKSGYIVTAASRESELLNDKFPEHPNLKVCHVDLEDKTSLKTPLQGQDIVYFLVHGMAHSSDFLDYETTLALNAVDAMKNTPSLKHVIFLSAIQPNSGASQHIEARKRTGEILRQLSIPVTELRAGVIIGPGSAAFEIMRDFVYNMPILIAPIWVDSKANPIALKNLNHYLIELAKASPSSHRIYEIGGPDTVSYREQFKVISSLAKKPYRLFSTKLLTPQIASYWLSLVTSVPKNIGQALLSGLEHDYIAHTGDIASIYPQNLLSYKDAVEDTLSKEGRFIISNVWGFDPNAYKRWQPGYGYYPKNAGASEITQASTQQIWSVIEKIGSKEKGYYFANILWRTREWMDTIFTWKKPVRQSPLGAELQVGDYIDSWKVIRCEKNRFLSLLFGLTAPGLGRLEFRIIEQGTNRKLDIRAWWHPKGFRGLLYWFAMMPAHLFIFRGMVRKICREAEQEKSH
ncbi:SDR family oxidoreductase [Vibrio sp.]|uniref:DUF2867 domain-containing protein n=1 Tax=Vibrio viridaestus TaxID=2487322 RepID=A0A3N9THU5_9VIBR|nr:DUF2867 domain-containing protein [Vibrio viridaestus]MDC0612091.1 SDR family oxidoreductase [Vibrio sp.]RQW63453.1 DUF2867 domain-containing protein [Vibrio viridaestus]